MPGSEIEQLKELIVEIQRGLVTLFDQFSILVRKLDLAKELDDGNESDKVEAVFSKVTEDSTITSIESKVTKGESLEKKEKTDSSSSKDVLMPSSGSTSAKVSRVLDPIAHEIRVGESPAEVLAEYLQTAKDYLITEDNPNEKVARDMDIVLRFLRARGKKGIRPEEQENILKRIGRWKLHLSVVKS